MPFIATTSPAEAAGPVRDLYERQQAKYGYVPNYAKVFCHRPEVMPLWSDLLYGVRRNMEKRRFELATVAAAMAIHSSYCSLAHGQALSQYYNTDEVRAIIDGTDGGPLTAAEKAMMKYARKVASDANSVTAGDLEALKAHGFSDAEIFDIAAVAAARTFFAKLCEGLGATPDVAFLSIDSDLRKRLTVGRPIDVNEPERVA